MKTNTMTTMLRALMLAALMMLMAGGAQAQTISTIAGNGTASSTGDGFAATAATLGGPRGIAFDSSGNLYFAEFSGHRVRKINSAPGGDGKINTVVGTGTAAVTGTGSAIGDGGAPTSATLNQPYALAFDSSGNLYISEVGRHRVRKVNSGTGGDGKINTVVGNGNSTGSSTGDGGAATGATLNFPYGLAFDSSGNLYIAEASGHRIRKVNSGTGGDGNINTFVGTGTASSTGDGGAATGATLNFPYGLAFDSSGNLYISEGGGNRVRKVNSGTGGDGKINTVAGNGTASSTGDGGAATGATLNLPFGLAFDSSGNLYIGESSGHRVRKVNSAPGGDGKISTVAGNGTATSTGDGGAATSATLNSPRFVTFDGAGNLYIAEASGHRIRKVTLPTVSVAVAPDSVNEGSATTSAPLVYTFTRDVTGSALTVNVTITGSATSGTDYTGATTSVTFAADSATATMNVTPSADYIFETSETVIVTVAAGTGYVVGASNAATGNITNDDDGLTVTTTSDVTSSTDNDNTLREAVVTANASAAGTTPAITFAPGVTGTITLTQGQLVLSHTMTITGPATSGITVDGLNNSRIFNITSGTVGLFNLTLTRGKTTGANYGGAIQNAGVLTLTNCTLTSNIADSIYGGAIYNLNKLTVNSCSFTSNTSTGTGGVSGNGGAIFTDTGTTLDVTNSTFTTNSAGKTGGQGYGGAILDQGGTTTLTGCTFSGNNVLNNGGAIFTQTATNLTATNCTFVSNSASDSGGAIYNNGTLTITGCTLGGTGQANTASSSAASSGGGGIYNNTGTLTVTGSTFSSNTAPNHYGGGIYKTGTTTAIVTNSTFSGNSAQYGGGIFTDRAITVTNCTLTGNTNTIGTGGGGGMYNLGGTNVIARNSLIVGNTGGDTKSVTYGTDSLVGGTAAAAGLDTVLRDNGGPTKTIALLPGSIAINTGNDTLIPSGVTTDQRGTGFARKTGTVDKGAFESSGFTFVTAVGSTPQSANKGAMFANPLGVTVTGVGLEPVNGGIITFAAVPGNGASATLGTPSATISAGAASTTATANNVAGTYSVTAAASGATTASFALTNLNRAPTDIALTSSTIAENKAANATVGTLSSTDPDTGDTFTYSLVTGTGDDNNASFNISGTSLRATNPFDFETKNTYSIRVRTTDQNAATFDKVFTITVTNLNEAPSGTDKTVTTNEDIAYAFTTADFGFSDAADIPPNTLKAVKITTLPAVGVLSDNGAAVTAGQFIALADITGGKLIFTPAADAKGTPYTSFTFQVQDDGSTANGGDQPLDQSANILTINVNAFADAPGISPTTTNEDTRSSSGLVITRNAADGAEVTHFKITSITGGSLFQNDGTTAISAGAFITAAQGTAGLKFTPASNANTAAGNTFSFIAQGATDAVGDGLGAGTTAVITVTAVNDAPTLNAISNPTINEDAAQQTINLSGIGTGAANETQTLTVTATSDNTALIANPTVTYTTPGATGTLTYTPKANQSGTAVITVTVTDNGSNTAPNVNLFVQTFTVTVNSVNDAPVITSDGGGATAAKSIAENTTAVTTVTATDVDTPAQTLTYSISTATGAANADAAKFSIGAASGVLAFITAPDFEAPGSSAGTNIYKVTVQVSDNGTPVANATQAFTITVTDVNDAPTITGFTPTSGAVGTQVTITGTLFTGATNVSFNGTSAGALYSTGTFATGYRIDSSTQITAFVPTGATTGAITVTTSGGNATSTGTSTPVFTVIPTISVAVAPVSVREDGTPNLVYTFTRDSPGPALTVSFALTGSATYATDYVQTGAATYDTTANTGTVTFAATATTATVTLNPATDALYETDETAIITLAAGTGYILGTPSAATGTITDDDAIISTYAGGGANDPGDGGAATAGVLSGPADVVKDSAGNLYISEINRNRIRRVSTTGVISTYAGTGVAGYANGAAASAQFNAPFGLALDSSGNLYVGDFNNNAVRMIAPGGAVGGAVTTFAGSSIGTIGNTGDTGPATAALLKHPTGLAIDSANNVYIADYQNARIRKVTRSDLKINAFAGGGASTAEGVAATSARIDYPTDIAVDSTGNNVYITDSGNGTSGRIRRVTGGIITTFAGTNTAGYTGDGGAATAATLNTPAGLALDSADNLYIGDLNNNCVRKVSGGIISTFAGTGTAGFSGDGGPATAAQLSHTYMLAVDSAGTVFVVDQANNRVRRIGAPASLLSFTPTSGVVGTSVVITGSAFIGTTVVKFNGTASTSVTVNSDTQITATVPTGATTGAISVLAPSGTVTTTGLSTPVFTVLSTVTVAVAPTSVNEDGTDSLTYTFTRSEALNTAITVNFGLTGSATYATDYTQTGAATYNTTNNTGTVTFAANATTATVTLDPTPDATVEANETAILTLAAGTGYVAGGTAATGTITNDDFAPTITDFDPKSGPIGTTVTITGTAFTGATGVTFNGGTGTAATILTNDGTQITAKVPTGATTGTISVSTPNGTATSTLVFTVNPLIVTTETDVTSDTDLLNSLREAITYANSGNAGASPTISFNIGTGAKTLAPTSAWPAISGANITIDGSTQTGYPATVTVGATPVITLDGTNAPAGSNGLSITGSGTTVHGLQISNWKGAAISVTGAAALHSYLRRNFYKNNATANIDLGGDGATPNDAGDTDSGPNDLQNTPVITAIGQKTGATTATVAFTLDSTPSHTYIFDFFASSGLPGAAGSGNVDTLLIRTATLTSDASGKISSTVNLPVVTGYPYYSATATDISAQAGGSVALGGAAPAVNETSEMSAAVALPATPDTTPPGVAFTSPGSGALPSPYNLTLAGTASDDRSVQRVVVALRRNSDNKYWNGSAWVSGSAFLMPTTITGSNWTVTTTMPTASQLGEDRYYAIAFAYDSAGNSSAVDLNFTVRLAAPTVTITTPQDGSTVSMLSSVSGTASDGSGIETGSGVQRVDLLIYCYLGVNKGKYWNGTAWGSYTLLSTSYDAASQTWRRGAFMSDGGGMPDSNLAAGSYQIYALGYDMRKNQRITTSIFQSSGF